MFTAFYIPKNHAAVGEEEQWSIRCKDQFLEKWDCPKYHGKELQNICNTSIKINSISMPT